MQKKCNYCNQTFECDSGRWFSNHVRWCKDNPKSSDTENLKLANQSSFDEKFGKIKEFKVNCEKCKCEFFVKEREKLFPKKEQYYCGRSCANTRKPSCETKEKIKKSLENRHTKNPFKFKIHKQKRICLSCNKEFEVISSSKKKFCSKTCCAYSRKSFDDYLRYKSKCKFNFNVWDYPDYFDLNLIYSHGWYKPKNRGNNLNGVSRDHMISIKFGWENGIDSNIISHPANCELMQNNKNISKNKKCSLLLEELKERIKEWNKKYDSNLKK